MENYANGSLYGILQKALQADIVYGQAGSFVSINDYLEENTQETWIWPKHLAPVLKVLGSPSNSPVSTYPTGLKQNSHVPKNLEEHFSSHPLYWDKGWARWYSASAGVHICSHIPPKSYSGELMLTQGRHLLCQNFPATYFPLSKPLQGTHVN